MGRRAVSLSVMLALACALAGALSLPGVVHAASGRDQLTARLVLDSSHVRSGGSVRGTVVIENRSGRPRVLLRTCAANGLYTVAVRAANGYEQGPAWGLVACRATTLVARPGMTVFRVTLRARYIHCTQAAKQPWRKWSPNWAPRCLKAAGSKGNIMPPLPPGHYTAFFAADGRWTGPRVSPATFLVTSAH